MSKRISIWAETDGWIMGRNGAPDIQRVQVHGDEGGIYIDAVSKARGVVVNGGLRISFQAMDELAAKWIAARKEQGDA